MLNGESAVLFSIIFFVANIMIGFGDPANLTMLGDSIDYHEWKFGTRLEGLLTSSYSFSLKVGVAFGSAMVGFALAWAGYDPANITEQAKDMMKVLTFGMPVIFTIIQILYYFSIGLTNIIIKLLRNLKVINYFLNESIDVRDIDDAKGLSVNEQLSLATDTKTAEFTVTGSENGQTYIGIFNDGTNVNMHTKEGTFVLDNLRIEKLDATPPVSTISDLKKLVEEFEETGDITSEEAAHALKLHLTALEHFERIGNDEKVVKHLNGFKDLLNHQKEEEQISDKAYETLSKGADSLIEKLD